MVESNALNPLSHLEQISYFSFFDFNNLQNSKLEVEAKEGFPITNGLLNLNLKLLA